MVANGDSVFVTTLEVTTLATLKPSQPRKCCVNTQNNIFESTLENVQLQFTDAALKPHSSSPPTNSDYSPFLPKNLTGWLAHLVWQRKGHEGNKIPFWWNDIPRNFTLADFSEEDCLCLKKQAVVRGGIFREEFGEGNWSWPPEDQPARGWTALSDSSLDRFGD